MSISQARMKRFIVHARQPVRQVVQFDKLDPARRYADANNGVVWRSGDVASIKGADITLKGNRRLRPAYCWFQRPGYSHVG